MHSERGARCQACGTINETGSAYCRSCGKSLAAQTKDQPVNSYCIRCGKPLPSENATSCPSCGYPLTAYGKPESPPQTGPPPQQPRPPSPANQWSQNDGEALSRIRTFGLIGIAGLIIGFVTIFGFQGLNYLNTLLSNTPGSVTINVLTGLIILAISLGSIVLEILAIYYARAAFRYLTPVDSNFQTPLSLSFGLYIGFILAFVGFVLTIVSATMLGPASGFSGLAVALLVVGVLMLIGGVVALIVGLVGMLLGIWRFGSRYDEGLFKAAAILYIIPVASIAAPILIYYGAGSVANRLRDFIPPKTMQGAV